MGAASKLLIVSLGVATAIGAPQPDPLLYTNPGLSYLSTQHVPYNYQFYRRGIDSRDRCLPNTYEDNTVHSYQIGNDHFYTTDLIEIGVTNVYWDTVSAILQLGLSHCIGTTTKSSMTTFTPYTLKATRDTKASSVMCTQHRQ